MNNIINIASKIGVFDFYSTIRSRIVKRKVAIIAYHRVDHFASFPWSIDPVPPSEFESEVRYLSERYEIISLNELCKSLNSLDSLPSNTAIITFDDGYKDVYKHAFPILMKYKCPATVFLVAGHIGRGELFWWDKVNYVIINTAMHSVNTRLGEYHLTDFSNKKRTSESIIRKLKQCSNTEKLQIIEELAKVSGVNIPSDLGHKIIMSWDDAREMIRGNINFGAHSLSHTILTKVPLPDAREEILGSKRIIEKETGEEVIAFSYPNGESSNYNPDLVDILKNNGFACAVTLKPSAFLTAVNSPFLLPRITGASNSDTFKMLLSGFYQDIVLKLGMGKMDSK